MNLDWQQRAACLHPSTEAGEFDDALLDNRGRLNEEKARKVAARVCAGCPVRRECLALATELTANGYAPQALLWAGMWWPPAPSGHRNTPPPINLLDPEEVDA